MDLSRQALVIGEDAQKKLENSNITIVGLGALGSLTSELLTRAGVKNIILIDRDYIEKSNLQRQHMFTLDDINKPKTEVVKNYLKKINPEIILKTHFDNLDDTNVDILKSDLILDCTDNLETRFLIDEYSHKNNIPWIFASAIKTSGYVLNIFPKKISFKQIFNKFALTETCETSGVLNTITSLISAIQANEAIKILINNNPEKALIHLDIKNNKITKIKVPNSNIEYNYEYLTGKNLTKTVKLCGEGNYLFPLKKDYYQLKSKFKNIIDFKTAFKYKEITVFKNKILIKTTSEKQAKSIYSKYIGN